MEWRITSRPAGILVGDDGELRVVVDEERGVDQLAVDAAGERSLAQARADAGGHFVDGDRVVEFFLAAVRQRDYGHDSKYGSREWDRTTDHFHVKEVLYH